MCTSTFSALNYCGGILLKYCCYLYEVLRTNVSADFLLFTMFNCNFAKIVAIYVRLATKMFDLPQTLHGDRARRANPERCQPFFDPIHIFSARGQHADFWPLSKI